MKFLEIIKFRTTRTDREYIKSQLLNHMVRHEESNSEISVKIYTRDLIDSDFLIQLQYDSDTSGNSGSQLGLCLASALKEFGIVSHSVWIEIQKK